MSEGNSDMNDKNDSSKTGGGRDVFEHHAGGNVTVRESERRYPRIIRTVEATFASASPKPSSSAVLWGCNE